MSMQSNATVRMFGCLHSHRRERGLESTVAVTIPPSGCTGLELAQELELPLENVEAIFVNHVVYQLEYHIQPGDRVAFIPTGVPGPCRLLLGIAPGKPLKKQWATRHPKGETGFHL